MESPKIFSAMIKIMDEVGAVGKDRKNESQGYKFRGIDDMLNAMHPAFTKHGVFMVPRVKNESHELKEVTRGSGKPGIDKHVHLSVEFDFVADDGSKVTVGPITSEGLDSGDKATNKALSAALKYALIQTFCIPTEDMEDGDKTTQVIEKPKAQPPKQQAAPATPAAPKLVTQPQLTRLFAMMNEKGLTKEDFKQFCENNKWNIQSSKELTQAQYNLICHEIEQYQSQKNDSDIPF